MLEMFSMPFEKGWYLEVNEIQLNRSAKNVTCTEFDTESIRSKRIETPNVPIAAIIWLFVSEEIKTPMEIIAAP